MRGVATFIAFLLIVDLLKSIIICNLRYKKSEDVHRNITSECNASYIMLFFPPFFLVLISLHVQKQLNNNSVFQTFTIVLKVRSSKSLGKNAAEIWHFSNFKQNFPRKDTCGFTIQVSWHRGNTRAISFTEQIYFDPLIQFYNVYIFLYRSNRNAHPIYVERSTYYLECSSYFFLSSRPFDYLSRLFDQQSPVYYLLSPLFSF